MRDVFERCYVKRDMSRVTQLVETCCEGFDTVCTRASQMDGCIVWKRASATLDKYAINNKPTNRDSDKDMGGKS